MNKRFFTGVLIGLSMAGSLFAATTQTLLINGEPVEKVVSSITFDGNNVVLHFGNETESHDMNLVKLSFKHDTSGLNSLKTYSFKGKIEGGVLTVSGLDGGTPIYIFNISGVAQTSAQADGEGNAVIDVNGLPGGIYIMQAGNNCIKFVKQ